MSEVMQEDKIKKERHAGRLIVIILLVIAIAAALYFLVLPQIQQEEKPDPSFVVLHSFPAGSPQAEYIEKTAIPMLNSQFKEIEAGAVYCEESKIDSEALRMKNEGKAPDVLFLTPETMAGLAQFGILAQLGDDDEAFELSAIKEAYINESSSAGRIEGITYGLPTDVSVEVLLYNPAMLPGTGGQPPSDLEAFWEMLGVGSSGARPTAGFILPDAGMKSLAPFVWSNGGELVNDEGTKASGFLNKPINVAVFNKFAASLENSAITVADGKDEALARFVYGETAMTLIDTSDIAAFTSQYPDFVFETVAFPAGSSGSVSVLGCKYVSITADARKDAAVAFVLDIMASGVMGTEPAASIPEAALAAARPLPMSWSMADMQNEFVLAMTQITDGYKTTQQSLDDLAMKWDAYLP